MNLNFFFLKHCKNNKFEINQNQLEIPIPRIFIQKFKQNLISKIFKKNKMKLSFYLVGDVGVGKTMILNFSLMYLIRKK